MRQRTEELDSLKMEIVRRCENSPADLSFLQLIADRQQEISSRRPLHRARIQSDPEPSRDPRLRRRQESRPETPVNGHNLPTEPSPVLIDPKNNINRSRVSNDYTLDMSDSRAISEFIDEVRRIPSPCPSTASSASHPPRPIPSPCPSTASSASQPPRPIPSPCPSTTSSSSYPPGPITREKPTERNSRSVSRDSGINGSGKSCSSYEELMASSKELTPASSMCLNDFIFSLYN